MKKLILLIWLGFFLASGFAQSSGDMWGPLFQPDPLGNGVKDKMFYAIEGFATSVAWAGGLTPFYKLFSNGSFKVIGPVSIATGAYVIKNSYFSGTHPTIKLYHLKGNEFFPVFKRNSFTEKQVVTDILFKDNKIFLALADGLWILTADFKVLAHFNSSNTNGVIPAPVQDNSVYPEVSKIDISLIRLAYWKSPSGVEYVFASTLKNGVVVMKMEQGDTTWSTIPFFDGLQTDPLEVIGDTLLVGVNDQRIMFRPGFYLYNLRSQIVVDSLNARTPDRLPGPGYGPIKDFLLLTDGRLAVAAGVYMMLFSWPEFQLEKYFESGLVPFPLPRTTIMDLDEDPSGTVWIASLSGATWWRPAELGPPPPPAPEMPAEADVSVELVPASGQANGGKTYQLEVSLRKKGDLENLFALVDLADGDTLFRYLGPDTSWLVPNLHLPLQAELLFSYYSPQTNLFSDTLRLEKQWDLQDVVPEAYELAQNYPNPFNPSTTIEFALPEESWVSLVIYDLLGRQVKALVPRQRRPAGTYTVLWDGTSDTGMKMPSGVYFYRMVAEKFSFGEGKQTSELSRKMLLIK